MLFTRMLSTANTFGRISYSTALPSGAWGPTELCSMDKRKMQVSPIVISIEWIGRPLPSMTLRISCSLTTRFIPPVTRHQLELGRLWGGVKSRIIKRSNYPKTKNISSITRNKRFTIFCDVTTFYSWIYLDPMAHPPLSRSFRIVSKTKRPWKLTPKRFQSGSTLSTFGMLKRFCTSTTRCTEVHGPFYTSLPMRIKVESWPLIV